MLHSRGSLVGLTANVRLAEDKRTSLLLSDDEETVLQNFLRLKDGEREIYSRVRPQHFKITKSEEQSDKNLSNIVVGFFRKKKLNLNFEFFLKAIKMADEKYPSPIPHHKIDIDQVSVLLHFLSPSPTKWPK